MRAIREKLCGSIYLDHCLCSRLRCRLQRLVDKILGQEPDYCNITGRRCSTGHKLFHRSLDGESLRLVVHTRTERHARVIRSRRVTSACERDGNAVRRTSRRGTREKGYVAIISRGDLALLENPSVISTCRALVSLGL